MEKAIMYRPELETMPREKLLEYQLDLFRKQMAYVYERAPFYRRKFDDAGIRPEHIKTLEDVSRIPFTIKEELRRSQEEHPPFGDFHCIPPEEGVRVFQTTGTTGTPVRSLLSKKDWLVNYYDQFMYFMYGYGITKADIIFIPFNYGLYLAWWGIHSSFEQGGVLVIPGGGQSSEDRIRNILEWKPTVICGTPTYILFLGDAAKKMGVDLSKTTVRIVITAGEPGAQVPSTKKQIETTWGAKNYDDIGSTEISNFGFECVAQKGTHVIESMFLAEVIDPKTGKWVGPAEEGELVLSNLCCESMPLIRWRMGDIVKFDYKKCDCGRTFLRLEGGIIGRADDMFQFGGVNIFPSAIENFVRETEEFSNEYQVIAPKMGSGKHLRIRVEPSSPALSQEEMDRAVKSFKEIFKFRIGVSPDVEVVKIGELPRFEGKAKRVIREA
ncbi:MAG: AMP-binding protein [Thermodesulfobacteriota bacterium]|jgi:phenylacetate-CoA ligase